MLKTATAIIPAYNEENNIANVLVVLKKARTLGIISEIIVVDDGSEDKTAKIALNYEVEVLRNYKNKGKAHALAEALKIASSEICIFIDADLVNLKIKNVLSLIKPLYKKNNCMTIARFINGRIATDISHTFNLNCSGQRAAKTKIFRKIFKTIKSTEKVKYGIENIITDRLEEFNIEPIIVNWDGVSQILKEEKWGIIGGLFSRIRMYISMNLGHLRNLFYNISRLFN